MSINENRKTTVFAVAGAVMLGLAALTWLLTQPPQTTGFERVGQEFFANFESSNQAASLEVSAIDPDSATLKQFRVAEEDGVWTIPSHYGYPAEASDRLATTSSGLIGLTRESLVGRLKNDHERFGVLDPLADDLIDPDAAGKRIILRDTDDEVLVDLIVGKEAGETPPDAVELALGSTNGTKYYYVRRPDETQTYKVALGLELSTRFADWIRPDLLDLDSSELRRLTVDNYELEEEADPLGRVSTLYKKQGDQMLFTRDTGFGPWSMDGLDNEQQQLDSAKIDAAVTTLDDLQIVGVRKKTDYQGQPLLNADLTLNRIPDLEQNIPLFRQVMGQLQQELSDYGFNLAPVAQGSQELTLVSKLGEVSAGTEQGVIYNLQFGNPVSGDEQAIEIGDPDADADGQQSETADESKDGNDDMDDVADESQAEESAEDVQNRYLMIRVSFDESLLGDQPVAPVAPVEPEKPAGYVPASEKDDQASNSEDEEGEADSTATADKNQADIDGADRESQPADDERPVEFQQYDVAIQDYEEQKTGYELKLSQYEDNLKEFNQKIEKGQERVQELNERFGAWFYVIAANNLESLRLKKDDLVSAKEQPPGNPPSPEVRLPDRPNINLDVPQEDAGDIPEVDESGEGSTPSDPNRDDNGDPQP